MFNVYNRYTDTAGNLHFTDCYEKHGREHIIRAEGGAGMSVVVRMEMPTKDKACEMVFDFDGIWYCPVEKRICRQPDNGEIPSWCPVICQLPEGHGRLVDAGRFERNMYVEWANGELSNSDWIDFRQWLKDEETVVPASDEERSKNESD